MKKIFLFILISLILIHPISAFSLLDFLRELDINQLTGFATTGNSTQTPCEVAGGICRSSCLSNEHSDLSLSCGLEAGGSAPPATGEATSLYCCLPNPVCIESWTCSSWSACINNQQTRTCTDLNACGTTQNKPLEIQSCTTAPTQNACEQSGGLCKSVCNEDEEINYDLTPSCAGGDSYTGSLILDYCCVQRSHCLDGTNPGECSDNFQYCTSNYELIDSCNTCGCPSNQNCINNICEEVYTGGDESGNQNLLNIPPIFMQILPINSLITNPTISVDLSLYAIDPNNDPLSFYFQDNSQIYNSEMISCTIINSLLNCNPLSQGSISLLVKASDGIASTSKTISITIFDPSLTSSGGGVIGAIENTPPVADAGTDKIVYVNQYVNLDGSKSYDNENNIITYEWFENENKIGDGIAFKTKFTEYKTHEITLKVTDAGNEVSNDIMNVVIGAKSKCLETDTIYFPEDTICNKAWPSNEGGLIEINSQINGCDLIEVCNSQLDLIIEDAIDCCDSVGLTDPKKANACNFAAKNSNDPKKCQALYLIKSLGSNAVYMQDYFEAEMCCYGVKDLCLDSINLYSAKPVPKTNKDVTSLRCLNSQENNPKGLWVSDTKIELNNIALSEIHAGASINILGTGTCVDYSAALVTLLRKMGYPKNDVFLVEGSTHAYVLVRFPLDKKYTIIDVTGNNDGIKLGKVPQGYKYCESIKSCYNEMGGQLCPENEKIFGCEGIKPSIFREGKIIGGKVATIFDWIKQAVLKEIKR